MRTKKPNKPSDLERMMKVLRENRSASMLVIYNGSCVKCGVVEKKMVRVGAVIFCHECTAAEFQTDDPVKKERDHYIYWLRMQQGEH